MAVKREWLKKFRVEKGYSQQEIADKLNIARTTWIGYENGYRTPRGKTAIQIANLLNFPVELFFYTDVRESQIKRDVL